jgi:uncharacterized protein
LSYENEKDHHSHLDFPFGIGEDRRIRTTDTSDHIKDEIMTILLTNPGERVNEPEFGCGLKERVFSPNDEILSTLIDLKISQALDRWLGDKIVTDEINVQSIDERLLIEIVYTVKETSEQNDMVLTVSYIG